MKRITKLITLLLAVVMLLSGCMYEQDTYTINSDGSSVVDSYVRFDKESTDTYIQGMGITDVEKYIKENMSSDTSTMEVVTETDGKQYYAIKDKKQYSTINELAQDCYYSYENLYLTTDTIYGILDMSEVAESQVPGQDVSTVMSYDYVFVFSAPVVATTGKIDAENPNKVTFTVNVTSKNKIFATTTNNSLESVEAKVKKMYDIKKPVIKSVKVSKINGKKATISLKIKKIKNAEFYVEVSKTKKFKNVYISKFSDKNKITIKGLKANKKYYVRVQTYKTSEYGIQYSSKFSKPVKVKTVKK